MQLPAEAARVPVPGVVQQEAEEVTRERYQPPSALEVAAGEPEVFESDEVELALASFDAMWGDHLRALSLDVQEAWQRLAESRGAADLMDAAERGLVERGEVQPPVDEAKRRRVDLMDADGSLEMFRVDGGKRELSIDDRREFALLVMSRWLKRDFLGLRQARVTALLSFEAPAGVEFHHRELRVLNVPDGFEVAA